MKQKNLIAVGAGIVWICGGLQACSSDDEGDTTPSDMGGAFGDGDGDNSGGTSSTGGTAGTGATTSTGGSVQQSLCELEGVENQPLPYEISEDFYYVNEIPEETTAAVVVDGATCDDGVDGGGGAGGAGGASGAEGSCYVFDYIPDDDGNEETALSWGGIIVQSNEMPDGMGSTGDGICIEPGATTITFEAKADNDITDVKFGAIRPGPGVTEHWVRLTSSWAPYTISIPEGETYNDYSDAGGVWNGFSAVLEWNNQDGDPLPEVTRISIRDVVWKN